MKTPVYDFVSEYIGQNPVRLHMPGHKGVPVLGCEQRDITEIHGADELYQPDGIIRESENNAAELFGTYRTFYSTEGSSLCIRAMLYMAIAGQKRKAAPVIVAARNAHKTFLYAAAMLDVTIEWLYPDESDTICSCIVDAQHLEAFLRGMKCIPAAVYITSPDYLGKLADIRAIAEVCHRYGTILIVDNAHGAYLHFLKQPNHPMDLGADLCCDSAHKTLPVLTGGAYLHVSHRASRYAAFALDAMSLFGSTSPSWLILQSLDFCNRFLDEGYIEKLNSFTAELSDIREDLQNRGWSVVNSDPLRITLRRSGTLSGLQMAQLLRSNGIECEYADPDYLVLMASPNNTLTQINQIGSSLGINESGTPSNSLISVKHKTVLSIRQAILSDHETVRTETSVGRVCALPLVSCPPAIPIVIAGERIEEEDLLLFRHYKISAVEVVK